MRAVLHIILIINHIEEIIGTIAGDDTIFIVIKQGVTKEEVIDALSEVVPNMR